MPCWRSASARMYRSVRPLNSITLNPSSMPNRSRKARLIARPPAPPLQRSVLSTSNRIRRATSALFLPDHAHGPRLPPLLDDRLDRLVHSPAHAVEEDDGAAAEADDGPDAQHRAEQVLDGADASALEQVLRRLKGGEESEAGAQLLHEALRLGRG